MSENLRTRIRPCTGGDLHVVLGLIHQLDEFTHTESTVEYSHLLKLFEEMEISPAFYENVVCEIDGRVAGFMSLIFYKTPFHTGGTALINELIVDQGFRGQGLGRELIDYAVTRARTRGMDEIEVGTEKSNLAAQEFYRKAGFDEEYLLFGMEF